MEAILERALFFALGILVAMATAGWTFNRTLAILGVKIEVFGGRLDKMESQVARLVVRVEQRRAISQGGDE